MEELDLTADGECAFFYFRRLVDFFDIAHIVSTCPEAIQKIASVRSVVQPLEFFLHQLEIFERCNFELNPHKHAAYRRFLMNFNAQEMIGKSWYFVTPQCIYRHPSN